MLRQATLTQMMASPPKPQLPSGWFPTRNEETGITLYFHAETQKVVGSVEKAIEYHQQVMHRRNAALNVDVTLDRQDHNHAYYLPTPGVPPAASLNVNDAQTKIVTTETITDEDIESCASVLTDMSRHTQTKLVTPNSHIKRRRTEKRKRSESGILSLLTQPCENQLMTQPDQEVYNTSIEVLTDNQGGVDDTDGVI